MKDSIVLYFGDVFWCTTPYEGIEIYKTLSRDYNVVPVFGKKDIRTHKVWTGNEKFWFDKEIFKALPFVEIDPLSSDQLLKIYNDNNAKFLLMSTHMQFKPQFSQRNRRLKENGVRICMWDTGGGDGLYCNSTETGWEYFFAKGKMWKDIMIDSNKYPKMPGASFKEDPENIFVTGIPAFDCLKGDTNREEFCKKYNLNPSKPVVAYLPGNPGPDRKYSSTISELHEGLMTLKKLDYQICFKTHPGDYISTEKGYYAIHPRAQRGGYSSPRYNHKPYSEFTLVDAQDGFDLYRACDFSVTTLSHVGFELGLIGKPIVSYKMKNYAGWNMCGDLCEEVYTDVNSIPELIRVCEDRDFIRQFKKTKMSEYFHISEKGSFLEISKALKKILNQGE